VFLRLTKAGVTLDQRRASLDPDATVAETLTGGRGDTVTIGGQTKHVIGYIKDFLFSPEQARTPVGVLSGGERNRLMLARALAQPSNLLVLDEPTNDLDLETLDLLEEMIQDYSGTVILVSHDRDFLDRTASSVLVSEGEGRWLEYAGGYTDMVAQRGRGVQARVVEKEAKPRNADKPAASPPAQNKRKLSFNEQHDLKTLPKRMSEIEAKIAKVQEILADAELYSRDPARFQKAMDALTTLQTELHAAEERWLELEMLREELEG
jgi:ABC transport system ATP-binding/permease protein